MKKKTRIKKKIYEDLTNLKSLKSIRNQRLEEIKITTNAIKGNDQSNA